MVPVSPAWLGEGGGACVLCLFPPFGSRPLPALGGGRVWVLTRVDFRDGVVWWYGYVLPGWDRFWGGRGSVAFKGAYWLVG